MVQFRSDCPPCPNACLLVSLLIGSGDCFRVEHSPCKSTSKSVVSAPPQSEPRGRRVLVVVAGHTSPAGQIESRAEPRVEPRSSLGFVKWGKGVVIRIGQMKPRSGGRGTNTGGGNEARERLARPGQAGPAQPIPSQAKPGQAKPGQGGGPFCWHAAGR